MGGDSQCVRRGGHRALRVLRWLERAPFPVLAIGSATILVVYALLAILPACRNPNTNGFAAYYTAARLLLTNPSSLAHVYERPWFQSAIDVQGLTVRDIFNSQPPTMSLLMAPFAWMVPAAARIVWVLFGAVCWLAGVAVLARSIGLAYGRWPLGPIAALCAVTTAYSPLRENFRQGQCYTILFLLLCVSFQFAVAPDERRRAMAGVPLGLMLVLKTAGFWLLLQLLLARRWRAVMVALTTAVLVAVFAAPLVGRASWFAYFAELPRLATDPSRYVTAYQTVTSLTGHLFVASAPDWRRFPVAHAPRLAQGLLLLVGVTALAMSLLVQRLAGEPDERKLSFAMLAALIVTMAPIAQNYHYVLVLPSVLTAYAWAVRRRVRLVAWACLVLGTLLLAVPFHLFQRSDERGARALLCYPRVYGAFLIWGWLVLALRRASGGSPFPGLLDSRARR